MTTVPVGVAWEVSGAWEAARWHDTSNNKAARLRMVINMTLLNMNSSSPTVEILDSRVILAQPFYIVKRSAAVADGREKTLFK
jgi:hypothetical protein